MPPSSVIYRSAKNPGGLWLDNISLWSYEDRSEWEEQLERNESGKQKMEMVEGSKLEEIKFCAMETWLVFHGQFLPGFWNLRWSHSMTFSLHLWQCTVFRQPWAIQRRQTGKFPFFRDISLLLSCINLLRALPRMNFQLQVWCKTLHKTVMQNTSPSESKALSVVFAAPCYSLLFLEDLIWQA